MTVAAHTSTIRVLAPGARIGRKLEVLRRLGEGGMGALWVARNLTTEAEVAIKVLRPEHGDNAGAHAAERFRHEAKLGAKLAHRNITRVYDLIEDDDASLVLVMELLHGETLQSYCEAKGPLPCDEAVSIIVPILGALQHAHDHGVVHRDVKPSNIFLHVDPDGHTTPKLLDFGIAKMVDSSVETRAGDVLGTPCYMSPEQVRAVKELDGRSDLFSIGTTLYEMITGENPFRTGAASGTLARVLEVEVDPDPRIEPRVWIEVQRALSKQTYERHASMSDFAAALCAAIGETLPASHRQPSSSRFDAKTEPRMRVVKQPTGNTAGGDSALARGAGVAGRPRRSMLVLVSGVAIVSAIAGTVWFFMGRTPRAPEVVEELPASSVTPTALAIPPPIASEDAPVGQAPSAPRLVGTGAPHRHAPPPAKHTPASPSAKPSASAPSLARTPGF